MLVNARYTLARDATKMSTYMTKAMFCIREKNAAVNMKQIANNTHIG
jgi:hypothetical protein